MVNSNRDEKNLSGLVTDWDNVALVDVTENSGLAFQARLKDQLDRNPDLFENYTTHQIAETLLGLQKSKPDPEILIKLYEAYKPQSNHEYRFWELGKRIELLLAIDTNPALSNIGQAWRDNILSDTDKIDATKKIHMLQAQIYGFESEEIKTFAEGPYLVDGLPTILCAGHDRVNKVININTFMPSPNATVIPTFRGRYETFMTSVLHEGIHTHQNAMIDDDIFLSNSNMRDVAIIMDISTYSEWHGKDSPRNIEYYLRSSMPGISYKMYESNPCEQEVLDFEKDIFAFLMADPVARMSLINNMRDRRQNHYNQATLGRQLTYPQPSPALAA